MLEGSVEILSNGKHITVSKGDFFFIPYGTTYTAKWHARPRAVFHSVHFNFFSSPDPFSDKRIPVQTFPLDDFAESYALVTEMQKYQYAHDASRLFALSAFYRLCAILLPRLSFTPITPPVNTVTNALKYIENNYTVPCTVDELARFCFLSASRFYFLFKRQTGCSPIVYKNKLCISRAAQTLLLEKHKSIEEISKEYGFESAVYFRRLFKKLIGKTPTQYREEETLL